MPQRWSATGRERGGQSRCKRGRAVV
jgi:hypothetical protein